MDLHLKAGTGITVKIGTDADAEYVGGLSLLGRGLGDWHGDPALRTELE